MWHHSTTSETKKINGNALVAVAVNKDKSSHNALKWATEHLLCRGKTVILIHVKTNLTTVNQHATSEAQKAKNEFLVSCHCFCSRKGIRYMDVILEENDVAKAMAGYVSSNGIEFLVIGTSSRHAFIRFRTTSISASASKAAPDFCTVYVIYKGKISSTKSASKPPPFTSLLLQQIEAAESPPVNRLLAVKSLRERSSISNPLSVSGRTSMYDDSIMYSRRSGVRRNYNSESELSDISFISSGRPSSDRASSVYDFIDDPHYHPASSSSARHSTTSSDSGFTGGSHHLPIRFTDLGSVRFSSASSYDSGATPSEASSYFNDELEAEMKRLRLELKQTMDMYNTACKEALTANQRAVELDRWRHEEEGKLEELKHAQELALEIAEKEKSRCREAVERAEAARRIAQIEAYKRLNAEARLSDDIDDEELHHISQMYRKYTIDEIELATDNFAPSRKIGEGGYGPVFKCYLDHTRVAVKVLRPDAAQGRAQFRKEIEVLSCIRHPNMVLLLGACPEYGILVYEYMANGSLEERLLRKGNTPALTWQDRFRIAAEIATGLLFLHQTKPEPIVHRDLKPGNVLLDQNLVSKISDVGLARLVPAVAENVTQCRMTSTAGTFCYIDPEYQQTGILGVKSDVYSLGIVLLQLLTARPAMGITHLVESAIEEGGSSLQKLLDPAVPDWPIEEAACLADIAIRCAEMRRKDRPDLGKVVLPQLGRLREFAELHQNHHTSVYNITSSSASTSPINTDHVVSTEVMSDPLVHSELSSNSQP